MRKPKALNHNSQVRTLAIKCYDEQLPQGWENTMRRIKSQPKKLVQILAIKHDRDYVGDDFWQPSTEKPHYHIIVRYVGQDKRMRVQQILRQMGVKYREEDKNLWACHGVETVGDFAGYAMYLTHETPDAERDGKTLYRIEEIVSNLTLDEIKEIRDGYIRVGQTGKVGKKDMAIRDDEAYKLGLALGNYKKWYGALDFKTRDHTSMKTVRESYYRGVEDRVENDGEVIRLCVFIQGAKNTGKTHACRYALAGKRFVEISGGGTGKYDRLKPYHDAILVNDDVAPNLLNMTDNYMCQAYKRCSNNPFWCGRYFIVTSNKDFDQWLEDCGITNGAHVAAMRSRFYICHLADDGTGKNRLVCTDVSTRGDKEEQKERAEMFVDFATKANASLREYVPTAIAVDYDTILKDFLPTPPAPPIPTDDDDDPPFT